MPPWALKRTTELELLMPAKHFHRTHGFKGTLACVVFDQKNFFEKSLGM
jgi:hypothetical protein